MRRIAQGLLLVCALGGGAGGARADFDERRIKRVPLARSERLSLAVGFGVAQASQKRFHQGVAEYVDTVAMRSPSLQVGRVPKSQLARSLEFLARYYAPRHVFVESGLVFLQNGASTGIMVDNTTGSLSYENLVIEMPLLVGMYWPFFDELYLSAGLGPTLFLFNQSKWSYDLGRISSFHAPRGGGFHVNVGGEWLISEYVGLNIWVRYRYGKSSDLVVAGTPLPPVQPLGELDMSGIGAVFAIRLYAM